MNLDGDEFLEWFSIADCWGKIKELKKSFKEHGRYVYNT